MKKHIILILVLIIICLLESSPAYAVDFTLPPSQIIIPSLDISLPVTTVKITEDETWEVSYQSASYGELTALPGNKGNTIIFAHALPYLFRKLPEIKKDDLIYVFTETDWFTYKVASTEIIDPSNLKVLSENNTRQLILYTCTGDNWQQRFIVKAVPVYWKISYSMV